MNFSLSDFFDLSIDADIDVKQFETQLFTREDKRQMFPTAELARASIKGLIAKVESEKIVGRTRVLAEFAVTVRLKLLKRIWRDSVGSRGKILGEN